MKNTFSAILILLSTFLSIKTQAACPTVGGSVSGGTTVCADVNSGTLTLSGHVGNITKWQFSTNGGTSYTDVVNTTTTLTFTNLTVGTYLYRAVLLEPTCVVENSATATVVVNPNPAVSFDYDSICSGNVTPFRNNSSITSGNVTYAWDFGDGGNATTINPEYLFASEGTYVVTLTATSSLSCSTSTIKNVIVYAQPSSNFTIVNSTTCEYDAVAFTNTTNLNGATVSYVWNFGDASATVTTTSPNHNYTAGAYTVTLTATSTNGCVSTKTSTANVYPKPSARFSQNNVCQENATNFSNLSSVSSGTLTYAWDLGTSTSTLENPTITFASYGSYAVELIASSQVGCTDTANVTTVVYPKPSASYTLLESCVGAPSGFTNNSLVATGTITNNNWVFGDGGTSASTNPTKTYANTGTYSVRLISSTNNGCSDTSTSNITVTKVENPLFTKGYLTTNTTVCSGTNSGTINLNGSTGAILNWQTTTNGGTTWTTIANINSSINYTNLTSSTWYRVETQYSACFTDFSDTVVIAVAPIPVANFTSTTVCLGVSTTLTSTSTITSGNINSYNWNFGDGSGSTLANPTHSFASSGLFTNQLIVSSTFGCVDTISIAVSVSPLPVTNYTHTNVCDGTIMTFTNTSTITSGSIATNNWTFGDAGTATTPSTTHTYSSDGTYDVSLTTTTALGCVNTKSQAVSVYERVNPSFSTNSVCKGIATSYTNNSSISVGNPTYKWYFGDGDSSTSINPSHQYLNAGSFTTKLVATNSFNCIDSISNSVTVFAQPTASFLAPSVCAYDSLVFTPNNTLNGASISTNTWDFGDGSNATSGNVKHLYAGQGTYQVNYSITSSNGCASSSTKNITVNAIPNAIYSITNVCDTLPISFTNTSFISTGSITYLWSFGNGNTATTQQTSQLYATAGSFNTSLIVTSNNGCKDTAITTAVVYPRPVPLFTINTTCPGSPNGFTSTSTISSGSISQYYWSLGDGSNSFLQNPTKTYASVGNYPVSLTTTSNNGCSETIIDTAKVTIAAITGNGRGILLGTTNACIGTNSGSLTLTGTTGAIVKWQYSSNLGVTWNDTTLVSLSLSYINLTSTRWYRVVTQQTACTTAISDTAKITIKPLPTVAFNVPTVCKGQLSNFTNTSSISVGTIASYNWNFGNGYSSTLTAPTYTYTNDGTYPVLLIATSGDGCIDSATNNVIVNPLPIVNYSQTNICNGINMSFVNSSSITSGSINSYSWNFGDGTSSTAQTPIHLYNAAGSYTVKQIAVSALGCKDSLSKSVTVNPRAIISYTSTSVCLGNTTSFSNGTTINTGSITYSWLFGDGTSSSSANPTHDYATSGTFQTKLFATSNMGCFDSIQNSVVVFVQPTANFTSTNICAYDSASFSNTSISGGAALSYAWEFGDGLTSTLSSPKHLYPNSGSFIVSLNILTANGCSSQSTKTSTIYQVPSSGFSVINVCDTETVAYTNTSTILSGNLTSLWSFGDALTSSVTSPTHKYITIGTYALKLISMSAFGCTDTSVGNVTIYPRPLVVFSAPTVCDGFASQFINSSTIGSGSIKSYMWDFGDGTNSITKNPTKEFLNKGAYLVNLLLTSDKGCTKQESSIINVNEHPIANFTFVSDCQNKPTVFTNTSVLISGSLTYSWNFDDNNNINATASPSYTFSKAGFYDVLLYVKSDLGCTDSLVKEVESYVLPTAKAGKDTSVSQGYPVQLNASGGLKYIWFPAKGLSNINISNPIAKPLETTNYIATVINTFGCVYSDTVLVKVVNDFKVEATNIFTPNGDGVNDTWTITNIASFGTCNVSIFDRWGKQVFNAAPYLNDWSGISGTDILPDGTYYYAVSFTNSDKIYKGAITLLRNKQ